MKCPYCSNTELVFIRRTRWARFIPGLEYYDCSNCGGIHSRPFIRPIHSFFIAIAAFLITVGIYWLKNQASPPYYSDVEKYIATISQPMKVSGPIEDFPAFKKDSPTQITESGPADAADHIGVNIPPVTPPVPKPEGKSTPVGAESDKKVVKEKRPPADTEPKDKIDKEKLKIKVLIGNRNRPSAKKLAIQLEILGYTVEKIDAAPRSDFRKLTIYYKVGLKALAQEIGRTVGRDFIDKELAWKSRFDLILVTGGNE